ncbi:hypothetical protein BH11BAC1_BH11BAC1_28210 [soil metagenome]
MRYDFDWKENHPADFIRKFKDSQTFVIRTSLPGIKYVLDPLFTPFFFSVIFLKFRPEFF